MLSRLGLQGKRSWEKFIPEDYLWGAIAQRKALLAGLLDTDGTIGKRAVIYTTTSPIMAVQFRQLVHSLCGKASIKTKMKSFTYKGEKRQGRISYDIVAFTSFCPFRLMRKSERWKERSRTTDRILHSIDETSPGEAWCIEVDSPDCTYVIQHGLVTHNTAAGAVLTWRFAKQGGKVIRVIGGLGFERGIRDIIVPEMRKWIPKTRIISEKPNSQGVIVRMNLTGDNGTPSVISFMSGEQDDKSFEGDIIDFAWSDEPTRKGIYTATLRGLLMKNGPMILTLTPLQEPWIYNDIWASEDKDIACFPGEMEDALIENGGHLSKIAMDSFVSKLTADEIDARVHGKFKHLIGRVFSAFSEEIHVVPKFYIPKDWPVWCAIDPHTRKPNAAVWIAVSPEEDLYVVNEVYWKAGIESFGKVVLEISKQYTTVKTVIDTSSETPDWNRRETARTMLSKVGVSTVLARKKNMKEAGRLMIQQALEGKGDSHEGKPKLFVFDSCKRTRFEFMNYVYDDFVDPDSKGVKEEPKKINDDIIDGIHYIIVERPRYSIAKPIEGLFHG